MPSPASHAGPDAHAGRTHPHSAAPAEAGTPSAAERAYLARGLDQPGGKLPLFDRDGQAYPASLIRGCIRNGWATPWFANPMKPDWLVCRLTDAGRAVARSDGSATDR